MPFGNSRIYGSKQAQKAAAAADPKSKRKKSDRDEHQYPEAIFRQAEYTGEPVRRTRKKKNNYKPSEDQRSITDFFSFSPVDKTESGTIPSPTQIHSQASGGANKSMDASPEALPWQLVQACQNKVSKDRPFTTPSPNILQSSSSTRISLGDITNVKKPTISLKFSPKTKLDKIIKDSIKIFVNNNLIIDAVGYSKNDFTWSQGGRVYKLIRDFKPDFTDRQINISGYKDFIKFVKDIKAPLNNELEVVGVFKIKCDDLFQAYHHPETKWPEYDVTETQKYIVKTIYIALRGHFKGVATDAHPSLGDIISWDSFQKGIRACSPLASWFSQSSQSSQDSRSPTLSVSPLNNGSKSPEGSPDSVESMELLSSSWVTKTASSQYVSKKFQFFS